MKQVTQEAPQFAPAHSDLAVMLAYFAPTLPPDQAASMRRDARTEANRALAIDPQNAESYVALSLLAPPTDLSAREALLRKGLAANPNSASANGILAHRLGDVGRVDEAVGFIQKAAAEDPFGNDWLGDAVYFLSGAGRTQAADSAVSQINRSWPEDRVLWWDRFQANIEERRWDAALANLDEPSSALLTPATTQGLRVFLAAAKSPTPASLARARTYLLESANGSVVDLKLSISGLAALGLRDDAFQLAGRFQPGPDTVGADSAFLFFMSTAPMRRDPRFMQLAERIGLLKYWRTTGKWPDFCREPGLPYACK
jgi:tetratricopeptide (TPR) repeat protein